LCQKETNQPKYFVIQNKSCNFAAQEDKKGSNAYVLEFLLFSAQSKLKIPILITVKRNY